MDQIRFAHFEHQESYDDWYVAFRGNIQSFIVDYQVIKQNLL